MGEAVFGRLARLSVATAMAGLALAGPAVAAAPPNDDVENAILLGGTGGSVPGTNVGAQGGPCESKLHGVWYRWNAPITGTLRLEVRSAVAHHVAARDDLFCYLHGTGGAFPYIDFDVIGGESFWIMVSGEEGPFRLDYRLIPAAKPANDDFADAQILLGQAGFVRVSNAGAGREAGEPLHAGRPGGRSLWFSWTAGASGRAVFTTAPAELDTLLAVYTGSSVDSLTRVAANDDVTADGASRVVFTAAAGRTYRIAVDGAGGAEGSLWRDYPGYERGIRLTWNSGPPPGNDDFANAVELIEKMNSVGWTRGASSEPGEPDHTGRPGSSSVWFRWTAPATGPAGVSLRQIDFTTLRGPMKVYTGSDVAHLTPVPSTQSLTGTSVSWQASAGTTYRIALDPGFDRTGAFVARLNQSLPTPNDDFADAVGLDGAIGTYSGSDDGASAEPGEPAHAGWPATRSVWFEWTAPGSGPVTFDTFATRHAPQLAVYRGQTLTTLVEVASNGGWGHGWSQVTFTASEGITYKIAFDHDGEPGWGVRLNWRMAGDRDSNPPTGSITHPAPEIDASGTLTMRVEAVDDVAVRHVIPTEMPGWTGGPDADPPYEFELDTTLFPDSSGFPLGALILDMGGNFVETERVRVKIENRAPTAFADAPDGAVTSSTAHVSAQGSDHELIVSRLCSLDGGPYVACDDGLRYDNLAEGDHVLRTHVVDRAGKRSIVPGTAVWTVDTRPVAPGVPPRDTTPPVTSAPFARVAAGVQAGARTIPMRLTLDASDPGSGIGRYEVERRTGAGAWQRVWSGRAAAITQALLPGRLYRFRVRAVDHSGNVSAWAQGEAIRPQALQETRGTTSGAWRRVRLGSAHGGALKHSSSRGAWAQVFFTGSEVALVSATGPARGKAQIRIDSRLVRTIDLWTARSRMRRIVFRYDLGMPGRHTLRVRVLGTRNARSSGKRVDVDAVLVLR